MNDNFNTTTLLDNLTVSLAEKTGLDHESAGKVVSWLVMEGVLDMPVVTEEFNDAA